MVKIQIISNEQIINLSKYQITYSFFSDPKTFDLYDINIINLQDEALWRNDGNRDDRINNSNDFASLRKLIENTKKSKTIIFLPSNYNFKYYKSSRLGSSGYEYHFKIKDKIDNLKDIISVLFPEIKVYDLIYENSNTKCGDSFIPSAFCFPYDYGKSLTNALGSEKATTLKVNDVCILTTLLLSNNNFKDFIEAIDIIKEKPSYPQWLLDLERFDDKVQNKTIKESKSQIVDLQKGIEKAQGKLQKNLRLKSILTENGNNLVSAVFDILQDILSYDLSEFKDKMREDFLIKLKGCTFIGEIKGITSNIKNENVSQLEVHYQSYLDDLAEKNIKENVKALLIINPQRNKPIGEREEVHVNQINLAKRNGSLIIPTIILLSIYEKFLEKQITSEQIIEIFLNQVGLIDFKK